MAIANATAGKGASETSRYVGGTAVSGSGIPIGYTGTAINSSGIRDSPFGTEIVGAIRLAIGESGPSVAPRATGMRRTCEESHLCAEQSGRRCPERSHERLTSIGVRRGSLRCPTESEAANSTFDARLRTIGVSSFDLPYLQNRPLESMGSVFAMPHAATVSKSNCT